MRLPLVMQIVLAGLLCGCADWSYQRIEIGQAPREYERALPADSARRTELGMCFLADEKFGKTQSIVVLTSPDRRVCGKFQSTAVRRDYGFKTETGYRLRGRLDPRLADLSATGPVDAARAVLVDLMSYRGEKHAQDAHAWVAGGLVRMLERWPASGELGIDRTKLADVLERIPGGGRANIFIDSFGVYHYEYAQGAAP